MGPSEESLRLHWHASVAMARVAERVVLASDYDAIVGCGPRVEIRTRGFPDQATFSPPFEALHRLGNDRVSTVKLREPLWQEPLGFISRGDHYGLRPNAPVIR